MWIQHEIHEVLIAEGRVYPNVFALQKQPYTIINNHESVWQGCSVVGMDHAWKPIWCSINHVYGGFPMHVSSNEQAQESEINKGSAHPALIGSLHLFLKWSFHCAIRYHDTPCSPYLTPKSGRVSAQPRTCALIQLSRAICWDNSYGTINNQIYSRTSMWTRSRMVINNFIITIRDHTREPT